MTSAGTSASIRTALDPSQTAGSQAAKARPARRTSINVVMLLATALMRINATQKPISNVWRQGRKRR
jgi:hypothetical protein